MTKNKSNSLFGFFWWFLDWGHSIADPVFRSISRISVWSDLEEIVSEMPWPIGLIFWWVPLIFASFFLYISVYAVIFAEFWFYGTLAVVFNKLFITGWSRNAHRVIEQSFSGIKWYQMWRAWTALSKKRGLHSFYATSIAKKVSSSYNNASQAAKSQIRRIVAAFKEWLASKE